MVERTREGKSVVSVHMDASKVYPWSFSSLGTGLDGGCTCSRADKLEVMVWEYAQVRPVSIRTGAVTECMHHATSSP